MTYLYLFWDHEEHGPDHLEATLDRNLVVTLFEDYWSTQCGWDPNKTIKEEWPDVHEQDKAQLLSLLEKSDEELLKNGGTHKLGSGWGGLHFQIVTLRKDDGK